ncbi:MAG: FecR family protein [Flavobacterium sp.]
MSIKKSELLIVKYLSNNANKEEIEKLTIWLEEEKNKIIFKDFVKANYVVDLAMQNFDASEVKKQLTNQIKKEKKVFTIDRFSSYYKYVAILIVALGTFYLYQNSGLFLDNENHVIPRVGDIVLQIDNQSVEIIDANQTRNITDQYGRIIGKLNKNRLVYTNTFSEGKIVYNTLKVPYGKNFEVQFTDGTVVHLNSGTSLRYPVQFLKNQNRAVYLIGEAYFEVSKDKHHPFTVITQDVNVEVLGTKFNVNTFTEDATTDVVLIEGKVSLYKDKKTIKNQVFLKPGSKATTIKGQSAITTEEVNTTNYTDWLSGSLVFKNASFNDIIKKLERHYYVTFINKNKMLGEEVFNARFDNEPIEVVLKYFSDSYAINYEINKDVIIIK